MSDKKNLIKGGTAPGYANIFMQKIYLYFARYGFVHCRQDILIIIPLGIEVR